MEQALSQEEREDLIIAKGFETAEGADSLELLSIRFYDQIGYDPTGPQPFDAFFRLGQRDVIGFIRETLVRAAEIRAAKGPLTTIKRSLGA